MILSNNDYANVDAENIRFVYTSSSLKMYLPIHWNGGYSTLNENTGLNYGVVITFGNTVQDISFVSSIGLRDAEIVLDTYSVENDTIKVGYTANDSDYIFFESGKNYEFLDSTNHNNNLPDILSIVYPYSDVIVDKYEENAETTLH